MRRKTVAARLLLATSSCTLASAAPPAETITYSYDALGRLVATSSTGTVNNGLATSIVYDAAGNRQSYAVGGASAGAGGCGGTVGIGGGSNTNVTAQPDGSYLVTKRGGGYGWNAEAVSSQGLAGPFELEFLIPAGNPSNVAAGVSRNPGTGASYATIDYGFAMQPDGQFWVYASGSAMAGPFSAAGNPVWVVRDAGGIITVRIGATAASATIVYTFAGAQSGTFYVDDFFYAQGSSATLRFDDPNSAGSACGTTISIGGDSNTSATVQTDGSYLVTKTGGGNGWNAQATSSQGLSGPFALRFSIPAGNPSNVAAGVSRNPATSASYATIDYGFSMQPDGLFWVYASGNAVAGPFNANGSFVWVVRDASGIVTVRTGATAASATVVYTFAGAQTGTFYVDSSLYAQGSQAVLLFSTSN